MRLPQESQPVKGLFGDCLQPRWLSQFRCLLGDVVVRAAVTHEDEEGGKLVKQLHPEPTSADLGAVGTTSDSLFQGAHQQPSPTTGQDVPLIIGHCSLRSAAEENM